MSPPASAARAGIVWLASYPKSGNTWFRAFLANLDIAAHAAPVSINALGAGGACSRYDFDELLGVDSSDLTMQEVQDLRPRLGERLLEEARELPILLKVHDAWRHTGRGEPLFSARASAGAIYFVRNPLDIVLSYANHAGHEDHDRTITTLADPQHGLLLSHERILGQLPQRLGSWSAHVESWLDQREIPVHLMRYEDMLTRPVQCFAAALDFAGLARDVAQVERALEHCRFERLVAEEEEHGFVEKSQDCPRFFRAGRSGTWEGVLSRAQIDRVIEHHGPMMQRLGYLEKAS